MLLLPASAAEISAAILGIDPAELDGVSRNTMSGSILANTLWLVTSFTALRRKIGIVASAVVRTRVSPRAPAPNQRVVRTPRWQLSMRVFPH